MQNIAALQDIPFILDKIKWINRKKNQLTENQQEKLGRLPDEVRKEIEKKILRKKAKETKDLLYIWAVTLEVRLKNSGLPPKITEKILELITSLKNGESMRSIEASVENLKANISDNTVDYTSQNEQPTQKKEEDSFTDLTTDAPFVQIRYTKERYEKATQNYFKNKILPDLIMAAEKPIVPLEIKREYPQKKGSQFPKEQVELEQRHENELVDLLVKEAQKGQAECGKPIQTPEEIMGAFKNMVPVRQKWALNAIKQNNTELVRQQEMEKRAAYEANLKKNIERQKRKKAEKETKRANRAERLAKQQATPKKQHPKTKVRKILKKAQQKQKIFGNKSSKGLLNRLDNASGKTNSPELEIQR